jgi:hypothetical protein
MPEQDARKVGVIDPGSIGRFHFQQACIRNDR